MDNLISFIISVMAGIVANYICKWLDREQKLRLRSQIIISCDKIEHMCYNMFVASSWARKEVSLLESIFSFIISVVAGIVANYICKWLDGVQKKGNQPKKD